jgi:hypothetical protein
VRKRDGGLAAATSCRLFGCVIVGYLALGCLSSGCGAVNEAPGDDGGADPSGFATRGGSAGTQGGAGGSHERESGSGGAAASGVGGAPAPIVGGAAGGSAGAGGESGGDHGGSGGGGPVAAGGGAGEPTASASATGGTGGSASSAGGTGGSASVAGGTGGSAAVPINSLYFSEYIEGSNYNKAVEIRNPWIAPIDLASCSVRVYSNGATSPSATIALAGTIAAGDVFVVCHSSADELIQAACDLAHGGLSFNGNDAVALVCVGAAIDVIGQVGIDPGEAWGMAPVSTINATLRRRCGVTHGDPNGSNAFAPELEWSGAPIDTIDDLGRPSCD